MPAFNLGLRDLKRRIVDLQAVALEGLRSTGWSPETRAVMTELAPSLDQAIQRASVGGVDAARALGGVEVHEPVGSDRARKLISMMSQQLTSELRSAGAGETGPEETAAKMSKVFRTWRTDEIERWVRAIVDAAYHDEFLSALADGGYDAVRGFLKDRRARSVPQQAVPRGIRRDRLLTEPGFPQPTSGARAPSHPCNQAPGTRPQAPDARQLLTVDCGLWTVDCGLWTVNGSWVTCSLHDRTRPLPNPDPPSSLSRGRRTLAILGVVLLFVLMSLRGLATFWTDYLWFDSIGFSAVWTTLVFSKVVLVLLASAAAFTLMFLNLVLADRLAPRQSLVAGSPDEEIVERFQGWVSQRVLKFRLAVSGFFGLLIGLGAGAWWEDWLLYQNRQSFGTTDPVFGNDLGYYIFETPFYRDLFGWGFQFFLITLLVVTALHYLNGGIQVQPRRQRVAPGVKAHLSVLVAIIALLKAGGYWLDRYDLLYSSRGAVFGATYTDVNAQLPALNLLIGISIVAAVLLLVNIRFRGWTIPAVAFGLWLVTSVALGGIWPAVVQRFSVQPDEINKELPFVERNIAFTREGYGLDNVEVRSFAADSDLDAAALDNRAPTIDNIRLWDPTVLLTTYRQLAGARPFYQFTDVDVDRYDLDGTITQVMLAARNSTTRAFLMPGG